MTKQCLKCGVDKPVAEFSKDSSARDGLQRWCKECTHGYRAANRDRLAAKRKIWVQKNRQYLTELNRSWRESNAEYVRDKQRRYFNEHREELNARRRAQAAEQREKVFDHYGHQCACCGSTDRLTIDHINGNGGEHRNQLYGAQAGGERFYRWLIRNGFPDDYQTLCWPCNRSKSKGRYCRLRH